MYNLHSKPAHMITVLHASIPSIAQRSNGTDVPRNSVRHVPSYFIDNILHAFDFLPYYEQMYVNSYIVYADKTIRVVLFVFKLVEKIKIHKLQFHGVFFLNLLRVYLNQVFKQLLISVTFKLYGDLPFYNSYTYF